MTDWLEVVAVFGIATSLVVVVYGLVLLQVQVFTSLFTKYAHFTAKVAQFVSDCINDFLVIACPHYLALTTIQYIGYDCQRLSAFVSVCLVQE